ncbi:MAG: glycosyltransferase [Acidimicrobiales bacterium]
MTGPRLVHLTTTAMSLDWLLRPQLEAFVDAGFDVVAMSAPGPHVEAIEGSGIRHVAIPSLTRSMRPARDVRALGELVTAFRRLRPAIVHTHNPKPGLLGRVAARAARVPVVLNTVHGLYALPGDRLPKRAVVYGLERLASTCSDAELLQNPEDLPVLRRLGVPHDKLTVLGNGVDLRRFDPARVSGSARRRLRAELGIAETTTVVGVVGRLVWEKGYATIFAGTAAMAAAGTTAVSWSAPRSPEKPGAVPSSARAAAEAHGVRFLKRGRHEVDLYAKSSTRTRSRPTGRVRSAMEAAAMGLLVVATDIRGAGRWSRRERPVSCSRSTTCRRSSARCAATCRIRSVVPRSGPRLARGRSPTSTIVR